MADEQESRLRAAVYSWLAEALAGEYLPDWIAGRGEEWPLFESTSQLAFWSPPARDGAEQLLNIMPEGMLERRARYKSLFFGSGSCLWLYESGAMSGRLLGSETFAVQGMYQEMGMEPAGAELPDYASIELAFLAYLWEQGEASTQMRSRFIRQHAGRWLPGLGRQLARSGDPVFGPIGGLLAGLIEEDARTRVTNQNTRITSKRLPVIRQDSRCTLCGFCTSACPTGALKVLENHNETALGFWSAACTSCGRCERICDFDAIYLLPAGVFNPSGPSELPVLLRRSPRDACSRCGDPMPSRAEMDFVRSQIGSAPWLSFCQDCRSFQMEVCQ